MADALTELILDAVQPGAILLGAFAASILYGITCLQTYIFFYKNARDKWHFKLVIYGLWILDTLHMAMVIHALYFYMIQNFGQAVAMLKPTWSLLVHVYFTVASDFIIRTIFGKRVWALSRSYILTGGIAATTLACAITGIIFTTKAFPLPSFASFSVISVYLYTSLSTGVASDVLVAISLCAGLLKNRTGFKRTDSLVHTLVAYAINTSLLTTICSTGCLITYAIWPERLIFLSIYFCLNKLYFNSLLAALNARDGLREKIAGISTAPTSVTAATATSSQLHSGWNNKELEYYELENGGISSSPVNTKSPTLLQRNDSSQHKILVNVDRHVSVDEYQVGRGVGHAF